METVLGDGQEVREMSRWSLPYATNSSCLSPGHFKGLSELMEEIFKKRLAKDNAHLVKNLQRNLLILLSGNVSADAEHILIKVNNIPARQKS